MSKVKAFKSRLQQWGLRRALFWELMHAIRTLTGFMYAYKDWTSAQHRKLSLSKYRSKAMDSIYLTPLNTERFIWYIETHNYASLLHSYVHPTDRALKSGFIGWYSIFGRQIPFNSRKAKCLGCEIVKKTDSGTRQYV